MVLSEEINQAELAQRVSEILHCLGIGNTLVVPDPKWLDLITKQLYPETSSKFGVSKGSVERAARTAISICWGGPGRSAFMQMAYHNLDKRPSVSEFLDIIADHIRRTS